MLQIRDLSISMRKDLRPLIEGFSFALNPGDRVAVVGEEGDGKSTLLKVIYDAEMVEGYAEWSGQVLRDGLLLGYLEQEVGPGDGALSGYEFCCKEPAFLESSRVSWHLRPGSWGCLWSCSTRIGRWALYQGVRR